MSTQYLLAIDAGTSGCRSFIFNEFGENIASSRKNWHYNVKGTKIDFEPELFWKIICENIKNTINSAKINKNLIEGVSATSFREGSVFLDKNGKELLGVPAHDLRALSQGLKLSKKYGEKLYKITARSPAFMFLAARIQYLKKKMKELYQQIDKILMVNEWIGYKLSGILAMEFSSACETMLFDVKKAEFSKELLELLEIPNSFFPELKLAGTNLGTITKDAANQTGLSTKTKVSLGGADSQCGLIGMNLSNNLETGIIAGSTTPIQMILDTPIIDEKERTWTNNHLLNKKWVIESNSGKTGAVYEWLRKTLFEYIKDDDDAYNEMDKLAKETPVGSNSYLAFMGAFIMNSKNLETVGASGFGGFLLPLPISEENLGIRAVVRATIEQMAYAIKGNILQLEEIMGSELDVVNICGGLTHSPVYNQILCDVLNKKIVIFEEIEASSLGAAICAAVGAGIYQDMNTAMQNMVHIKKTLEPSVNSKKYHALYKKWLTYFDMMRKI